MTNTAAPATRFLHTPAISTTTYLVADTSRGRALQRATPEESTWITVQRHLAKAFLPLAIVTGAAMGFTAGDQLAAPRIAGHPLLGDAGYLIVIGCALAAMAAHLLSTQGHWRQRHLLATFASIAEPTPFTRDDLATLPATIRGTDALVVLSRAADTQRLAAVYTELAHPGGPHRPEVEAALADLTHP